jgi:hypothetical protein
MRQNLIYVAAVCQILSLPISLAIWIGWKPNLKIMQGNTALGIALAVVQLSSWAALYSVYAETQKKPVTKVVVQREPCVAATTPNSIEVTALREQNTQLRTENAHLRKAKAPHLATVIQPLPSAIPSACPSVTQVLFPSRMNAEDCDALTGAQRLVDSADRQRMELIRALNSGELRDNAQTEQQVVALKTTYDQAVVNLQGLQSRLCAIVITATPAPTGH